MPTTHQITIQPQENKSFKITWHNPAANRQDYFLQSEHHLTPDEITRQWRERQFQREIGRKLFRFLDGDARHFSRALDQAAQQAESLELHLNVCEEIANWPFELLTQDHRFLLPAGLHLVRQVSDRGAGKTEPPANRPLKLLFLACSALDVKPELDFEQEEETIFRVTEKLAINMEVEDTGSLAGLREQLEQERFDVVHLSGHADIDEQGLPFFVMEDETGRVHRVYPHELWQNALIENPPQLLFLSGCRTGETPELSASLSFAQRLVANFNVPAVLSWGRSVGDAQASFAAQLLYHELCRGRTLLDAVQRVRHDLLDKFHLQPHQAWPLLRLYSASQPLSALVTKGQRPRPQLRRMVHKYLQRSQVRILTEGFVGRRRQLQQSLRTLKQDQDKVGLLLHGSGGLGKSCLAGKISERLSDHQLVVVHGVFNTVTLQAALKDAFIMAQDNQGREILAQKKEMFKKIADLCATIFKTNNYLLLLDDFEQNLEGAAAGQPGALLPETALLLTSLLDYLPLTAKMS